MPKKPKQETMRAAVYYNNQDIRIEERPVPKTGDDEILVRIESSGICGSDVMEWYRLAKAPLVLGHEIAGTVAKAGKKVRRFTEGDRVTVAHHVPCNACRWCLAGQYSLCDTLRTTNFDPGGFCEYVRVPAINVDRGTFLIPDEISFDEGTFIEPLACVLRGLRVARFRPGASVLVLGSGISGLLFVKALGALGAGTIVSTDIDNSRLAAAKRFGADATLAAKDATPQKLASLNGAQALRSRRHERGRRERRRAGVPLGRPRRNGAPLRAARAGNDRAAPARGDLARPDRVSSRPTPPLPSTPRRRSRSSARTASRSTT